MSDGFHSLVGLVELLSQNVKHISRRLSHCETCIQQLSTQVAQMEENLGYPSSCSSNMDAGKRIGPLSAQAEELRNITGVEQVSVHSATLSKGLKIARGALDATVHGAWQQIGDPMIVSNAPKPPQQPKPMASLHDFLASMEPKSSFESFSSTLTTLWTSLLEDGVTSETTGGGSPLAGERGLVVVDEETPEVLDEEGPTMHLSKPVTTMLILNEESLSHGAG